MVWSRFRSGGRGGGGEPSMDVDGMGCSYLTGNVLRASPFMIVQ